MGRKLLTKIKKLAPYLLYYGVITVVMVSMALLQPFNYPPDEDPRYKIVTFIRHYGYLPTGYEPEVLILGFGGSYAFMPMLPYIIMGFMHRGLTALAGLLPASGRAPAALIELSEGYMIHYGGSPLYQLLAEIASGASPSAILTSPSAFLISARLINVISGLVMAVFVRKAAVKLFKNNSYAWLMSYMVMFLPQLLFIHSYVNNDSFSMTASSIIIYGCLRGREDGWSVKSCLILSLGIIICALSYYNTYGAIVMAIIIYLGSYLGHFDRRLFIRRSALICSLVLIGIGWFFIRSMLVHDGDLLGLRSNMAYAARTAIPEFNPAIRETMHSAGYSLLGMLTRTSFIEMTAKSFVACFESMRVYLPEAVYKCFRLLYGLGLILLILTGAKKIIALPRDRAISSPGYEGRQALSEVFFHLGLLSLVVITIALGLIYSYYYDFQPQGRYFMPILIPLCYYVTLGYSRLLDRFSDHFSGLLSLLLIGAIVGFLTLTCAYTVKRIVLPRYVDGLGLYFEEDDPLAPYYVLQEIPE